MDKDQVLRELYYDNKSVAYLANAKTLYDTVKQNHKGFTLKFIKDFLSKQEVTQILAKKVQKFYPPIVGSGPDEFQVDLTFFNQYKRHNNGFGIIIAFIEITTRRAFCYPLKSKTSKSVCDAYELFLKDVNYKVRILTSDNGSEFISNEFKKIDNKHNIIHNFVDAGDKTSMGKIER